MIHSLFRCKSADWWHNTKSIAGQEDHILGVTTNSGDPHVLDMLKWVANTGVVGDAGIVVIDGAEAVRVIVELAVFK